MRRGRGFRYVDVDGEPVSDEATLERIRSLTIPPAWQDVWICVDPRGHLQATGIDAAGRKQYLYHEAWRLQRDRLKFRRMVEFAESLPRLRRRLAEGLAGEELDEVRVLACAVRLLDVGLFRIGGEEYAEQGGGLGLATLQKAHVTLRDEALVFDYPAKSGVRRVHEVRDPQAWAVIGALKRRRGGGPQLLAYRAGRRWTAVHSEDINDYIKRTSVRVQRQGLPDLERDGDGGLGVGRGQPRSGAAKTPHANARSTGRCDGSPSCSATPRRSLAAPTSIRACSIATAPGRRSASRAPACPPRPTFRP